MRILKEPISLSDVMALAKEQFGEMVKATVDVERGMLAIGGELHCDEEALLLEDGSKQQHLWGINIYPEKPEKDLVEFDSMINVRPSQNNRSRGVDNPEIRTRILRIVKKLVHP
ncbi:MAG: hypothetical protein A3J74_10465 [Elusimicrobia bacterium RIFCSPHIGHO2_02_FULL_57_9]|nr:MAG: hypothetical protein A3J74_10465 [Elusimicrobia bacterium RIFCSPHIGHO2_02_FULL_57_9]